MAGAAYWQNWSDWIFGGALGIGLFALGFGLTAWGKYLMPQGPFVEERHTLASTPEERDIMSAALVERSAVVVKRRRVLGGLFAAGAGVFGDRRRLPPDPLARPACPGPRWRPPAGARAWSWWTRVAGRCARTRWSSAAS